MSENSSPEDGLPDSLEFDALEAAEESRRQFSAIDRAYSEDQLRFPNRTLPHSRDAEIALLSAILHNNAALLNIKVVRLEAEDLFRDAHQRIFKAMRRMCERGIPIEFATLVAQLEQTGELDEVGGRIYLKALVDFPKSEAIEAHVQTIRDRANLRALIHALNESTTHCYLAEETARRLYGDTLRKIWELGPRFLD